MLPGEHCAECIERAKNRKRRPSCQTFVTGNDAQRYRPCEWLAGQPLRTLSGPNQLAWDVCQRAVMISADDFNGNPTLASLQIALDSFPDELSHDEFADLLDRVSLIYHQFWLVYAAEKRRRQESAQGSQSPDHRER